MSPRATRAWAAAGTVAVATLVNITTGVLTEKWTSAWCAFLAVLVVVGGALHAGTRRRTRSWAPPFTGHTGAVTSVAFSLDSKVLASGSEDHSVRLWTV